MERLDAATTVVTQGVPPWAWGPAPLWAVMLEGGRRSCHIMVPVQGELQPALVVFKVGGDAAHTAPIRAAARWSAPPTQDEAVAMRAQQRLPSTPLSEGVLRSASPPMLVAAAASQAVGIAYIENLPEVGTKPRRLWQ